MSSWLAGDCRHQDAGSLPERLPCPLSRPSLSRSLAMHRQKALPATGGGGIGISLSLGRVVFRKGGRGLVDKRLLVNGLHFLENGRDVAFNAIVRTIHPMTLESLESVGGRFISRFTGLNTGCSCIT